MPDSIEYIPDFSAPLVIGAIAHSDRQPEQPGDSLARALAQD